MRVRTPELVMDLDVVADAYRDLAAALPGVGIHYAMKCNPHPAVLRRLQLLGSNFEIASAPELDTLLELGVDPAQVIYSNPVKPISHIERTFRGGVARFAFDSLDELAKLGAAAPGSAVVVRLGAQPERSDVPSEGKFGVDPDVAVTLLLAAREYGLRPHGVAFHVGSQMLTPSAWKAPLQSVAQIMNELLRHDVFLGLIDVGGGFPARYGTVPLPPDEYGAVILDGLAELPYPVSVVAEPGRALVAEAGTLTATVIGMAERAGERWVHLDVGAFNGFMESLETRNRLRYPVGDSRGSARRDRYHLTGPTCDSQDTILFDVELSADLVTGDQVYVGSAGSYTIVYASAFNGFDIPTVRCVGSMQGSPDPVEWSRSIETPSHVGYARRDGGFPS
jgi:ornithine decarboxylase